MRFGKGGGDRNCIPNVQVLQQQRRSAATLFQLEPNGAEHRRLLWQRFTYPPVPPLLHSVIALKKGQGCARATTQSISHVMIILEQLE
jgi:hypothetical protein